MFDANETGRFKAVPVKPMWRVGFEVGFVFILAIVLCLFLVLMMGCTEPEPIRHAYTFVKSGDYYYVIDEHGEWVDFILHKNSADE